MRIASNVREGSPEIVVLAKDTTTNTSLTPTKNGSTTSIPAVRTSSETDPTTRENLIDMLQSALLLAKVRENEENQTMEELKEQIRAQEEAAAEATTSIVPKIHTRSTPNPNKDKAKASPLHKSTPLIFLSSGASSNPPVVSTPLQVSSSSRSGSPLRKVSEGPVKSATLSTLAAVTSYRYTHVTMTAAQNNRLRGGGALSPRGRRDSPQRKLPAGDRSLSAADMRDRHFSGGAETVVVEEGKEETHTTRQISGGAETVVVEEGKEETHTTQDTSLQDELAKLRAERDASAANNAVPDSPGVAPDAPKPTSSIMERLRRRREGESDSVSPSTSFSRDTSPLPTAPTTLPEKDPNASSIMARLRSKQDQNQSASFSTDPVPKMEETSTDTESAKPSSGSSLMERMRAKREAAVGSQGPPAAAESAASEAALAPAAKPSSLMDRLKQRRVVTMTTTTTTTSGADTPMASEDSSSMASEVAPPKAQETSPDPVGQGSLLQRMRMKRLQADQGGEVNATTTTTTVTTVVNSA